MISMDKKYRTRDGNPVRLLCVDMAQDTYPVVALVTEEELGGNTYEILSTYTTEGIGMVGREDNYDLIEVPPYEDFNIDDPVMVRDIGNRWCKRHFAGVGKDGIPMTFNDGKTAWSSEGQTTRWDLCRRPTEEEMK